MVAAKKKKNTILIKKFIIIISYLPTCTVNSFVEIVQYMQCTFSDHSSALGRYILSEQFSQDLVLWKAVGKRRQEMRTQLQNSALTMLPLSPCLQGSVICGITSSVVQQYTILPWWVFYSAAFFL